MSTRGSHDEAHPLLRPSDPEEVPERASLRPRTVRDGLEPGFALADQLGSATRRATFVEEDEDGVETVLESHWGDAAPLDQLLTEERWGMPPAAGADPHTEWRDRMPVAFITDAVIDDRTVEDPRTDARKWREHEAYELNPALPRRDEPQPVPSPRPAAPVASPAASPPSPPQGVRTVTPPLGKSHRHGLPQLGSWEGSLSPSPPYRSAAPSASVQGVWGPVTQMPLVLPPPEPSWWDEHASAVVGGAAVGVVLGAFYLLVQLL